MSTRARNVLSWLLISFATLAVLFGLVLGAFGFVVGRVPEYRVQVQDWLSKRTGVVVEFRTLSARLRVFGPELVFHDAVVRTPDRTRVLATAARGSVGFDIWGSLTTGRLTAGRFWLKSPQLALIRTREGRIRLVGQALVPQRSEVQPLTVERLPTGSFAVEDAVVSFSDEVTGRGPWSFSGISFELTRDLDEIDLLGTMSLPRGLGGVIEFSGNVQGELDEPEQVLSTFAVNSEHIDLAGWADVFPDEWLTPETGQGSLFVSGGFRGAALTHLSAKVALNDLVAVPPTWSMTLPTADPMPVVAEVEDGRPVVAAAAGTLELEGPPAASAAPATQWIDFKRFAFTLQAQRVADEWTMALTDVDLSRAGSPWQASKIQARWRRSANGEQIHFDADRVVLQNLWPVLAYLPENERVAHVRALSGRGAIERITARFERAHAQAPPAFEIEAQLRGVGFEPVERTPGLAGLSGRVRITDAGGQLQLDARVASFHLPRMFREVLRAERVQADVAWERTPGHWIVRANDLQVNSPDGIATARVQVIVPRDGGSPRLTLAAAGRDLRVSSTGKYVPGHKLSAKTLAWFDRAFVDGRVTSATVEIEGATREFPFRDGEGRFVAAAHVEGATVHFQEGWLPATDIRAQVEFRNAGMHVEADAARVGQLEVLDATADIADFKHNNLRIKARSAGDVQHALDFLASTPIGPKLGARFARLRGQGALGSNVELFLPLKHLDERQVIVVADLKDVSLSMRDLDAPLQHLNGSLTVNNSTLAAGKLRGQWLGGPLNVNIFREPGGAVRLAANGTAQAAQLAAALDAPSTLSVQGRARWQLSSSLPYEGAPGSRGAIRLSADLRELELALPPPLGKSAGEARELVAELVWDEPAAALLRASSGQLRTVVSLRQGEEGWQLERGGLRADGATPSLPDHRGLRIEGRIERFALDEWLALRDPQRQSQTKLSDYLHAANVRVDAFELYGYRWSDVRGVLQSTSEGWRIDVSGPAASGQVLLPDDLTGSEPLRLRMEHLKLEKLSGEHSDDHPVDPRKLPALDVQIAALQWSSREIGKVQLNARRVPDGLQFEQVHVDGVAAQADARGQWLMRAEGPSSSISARITSTDVASTLRSLNYSPFLEAQHGHVSADLRWPGGFDGNVLEHASGTLSLEAKDGQLVNLQPGAGRMLGLFSVAALPRRLALDFSDLTEKGLAFDTIHGDFELRDGNAFTDNLLLRGPAAEIGIAGRTGLGSRDYDQTAVVTGNLGASLPVAGALAGGPAVGAALLLFSQVFKEPLKGITRGYYRITGPWDNPVVERVDASTAKDATASLREH